MLSHLHFDHAGGLLAPWQEGVAPSLLFPNAHYVVGRRCWERALQPHARDRASFVSELQPLLQASGRLDIVDGETSAHLGPHVRFSFSDGHTPGLMLAEIDTSGTSSRAGHTIDGREQPPREGIVFCADLIPGRPWVHLPVTMGYDRAPELLIDEKRAFLEDKLARGVRLFFTHDAGCALAAVTCDPKGRFGTRDELPALTAMAA